MCIYINAHIVNMVDMKQVIVDISQYTYCFLGVSSSKSR